MLLTCPNCDTSYVIPHGAVGPEGRQVQCSSCSHVWFQGSQAEQSEGEATPTFVSSRQDDKPAFDRELAQELAREPEPELAPEAEPSELVAVPSSAASIPAPEPDDLDAIPQSFSHFSSLPEDGSELAEKFFEAQAAQEHAENLAHADEATEPQFEDIQGDELEVAPLEDVAERVGLDAEDTATDEPDTSPDTNVISVQEEMEIAAQDLTDEMAQSASEAADEVEAFTSAVEETLSETTSEDIGAVEDASQTLAEDVADAGQNLVAEHDETIDTVAKFEDALSEPDAPPADTEEPEVEGDSEGGDFAWGATGAGATAVAATAATAAAVGTTPRLKSYSDLLGDTTSRARDLTEVDNQALTRSLRDQIAQAEEDEDARNDVRTRLEPAQRRTNLPDADELNSSLREVREERKRNEPKRSGFLTGFMIALLLGFLAVAVYIFAPQLSIAVPALEEPLKSYVAFCDGVRDSIAGLFGSS